MQLPSVSAVLVAILVGLASSPAFPAANHLPEEVRASLKSASAFKLHMTVAAIPSPVRLSFAKASREEFSIAEPGAEWQVTDVIRKPGLPRRRLAKVELSESFCILFYELGGRGHSHHVAVFRLSAAEAKLVWHAVTDSSVQDPAALLKAIDQGKVDDDPGYYL